MKLLFENWRRYLEDNNEKNDVEVRFPDKIPIELLKKGEADQELTGFVHPDNPEKDRGGIYLNDELVGFMTPREEKTGWRVGAIYIQPEKRKLGIASAAIKDFLADKDASQLPIGINNTYSQKAFANAGFVLLNPDEILTDKNDDWEYQIWTRDQNKILDKGKDFPADGLKPSTYDGDTHDGGIP